MEAEAIIHELQQMNEGDASPEKAQKIIVATVKYFGEEIALATSFGAEDQVLTDLWFKVAGPFRIFTLDTGRLPQETYDIFEQTRTTYGLAIKTLFPQPSRILSMADQHGPNLFYQSIEERKLCCEIRKLEPLREELKTLKVWVCGLRKEQAVTRSDLSVAEWDGAHGLIKICPLADWSNEQVWDYIRSHKVPYNALHDRGYPSIGCAPCTRAVKKGEDIRAGRWWWELPEHKECGLHRRPTK